MGDARLPELLAQWERREIDRRRFLLRAAALGLSVPMLAALATGPRAVAVAQSTPPGGPADGGVLIVSDTPPSDVSAEL